jgi:quinol monooxygenase YgiN
MVTACLWLNGAILQKRPGGNKMVVIAHNEYKGVPNMIKVVAKQFIKEGKLDEFLPIAKRLVEETNKKDPGCRSYAMYQDISNPLIVTVIEEWEDQESLDKHMKAAHFLEAVPTIGGFCEKPPEMTMYKKLF